MSGQRLGCHFVEPGGYIRSQSGERWQGVAEAPGEELSPRRRGPGEHLVQHASQAVHVAPLVEAAAASGLLGTGVGRCPDREAGVGDLLVTDRAGDPEVGQQPLAVLEQDVPGFTSRWSTPWACAWASASATSRVMSNASPTVMGGPGRVAGEATRRRRAA